MDPSIYPSLSLYFLVAHERLGIIGIKRMNGWMGIQVLTLIHLKYTFSDVRTRTNFVAH